MGMGLKHTCAILEDDTLTCWGLDSHGALGNGDSDTSDKYTPQTITTPSDRKVVKVEPGETHTCILLDDGGVMCWGRDNVGQLGNGDTSDTIHAPSSNVELPEVVPRPIFRLEIIIHAPYWTMDPSLAGD